MQASIPNYNNFLHQLPHTDTGSSPLYILCKFHTNFQCISFMFIFTIKFVNIKSLTSGWAYILVIIKYVFEATLFCHMTNGDVKTQWWCKTWLLSSHSFNHLPAVLVLSVSLPAGKVLIVISHSWGLVTTSAIKTFDFSFTLNIIEKKNCCQVNNKNIHDVLSLHKI